MNHFTQYFAAGILLLALTLSPCLAAELDDDTVAENVKTALKAFPPTSDLAAEVTVEDGVVTLEGLVENFPTREMATETASTIRGATAIINRLRVNEQAHDDRNIKANLDRLFQLNFANEDGAIDYKVNDGVITLTGTVSSYGISYLAREMAGSIAGARSVTNLLRVRPLTPPADEEIRQHLALLLRSDPWVSEDLVTTTVENGIVRLSGAVDTVSARSRLIDAVSVYGVTQIDATKLHVSPELRTAAERAHEPIFRSDQDLAASVEKAFTQDPRLTGSNLEVEVVDQMVTLTGSARSIAAKSAANADATNVPGVAAVFDFVQIHRDPEMTDSALKTALEEVLRGDALLAGSDISLEVEDGHVTLAGEVDNPHQRRRALKICAHGTGVTRVTSRLRIDWIMPEAYTTGKEND